MDISHTKFKKLKEKAIHDWASAKRLPKNKDTLPMYTRAKSFINTTKHPVVQKRQEEFLTILRKEVKRLLGTEVAESVVKQLKLNHSFSTAQHFSSILHPWTLSASLQAALPYFDQDSDALKNIIVLSCANISFDNQWFPRGFIFHSVSPDGLVENRRAFFSRKVRPLPITNHESYKEDAIAVIIGKLQGMRNENLLSAPVFDKIRYIVNATFADPKVLSQTVFTDQITMTSFVLWKKILEQTSENLNIPNLVFVEQENIVMQLLLAYHVHKPTVIHELLFNPEYHSLLEEYFEGIQGGFSQKNRLGTFLFWAMPKEQKYRTQLFRKRNMLVTADESYKISLTPDGIEKGIREKTLIPSTLLSLLLLSMYYGYILIGGMEQANYLTQAKQAFIKLLEKMKDLESIEAAKSVPTTNNVITRPMLTYIEGPQDARVPASGLDMLLYAEKGSLNKIFDVSKKVTLGQLLDRVLPNIYKEHTPDEEKTEELMAITERQIEKLTGLDKLVPPLAKL